MPDIWVDPLFGNDSNNGQTPAAAKASFAAGWAAVTSNNTLWLMTGNYIDQVNNFTLNKTNVTVRASGVVRIFPSTGGGVVTAFTLPTSTICKFVGIRFEEYVSFFLGSGQYHFKNCTVSRLSAGSSEGFRTTANGIVMRVNMENCTFRNIAALFNGGLGAVYIDWARNIIYDGYTTFRQNNVTMANSNYNAHSAASGGAGSTPAEANSLYSVSNFGYRNTAGTPPDLSIDPDSAAGQTLMMVGEWGTNIGAWFWPTMISGTDTRAIATDWANWSNDELWYDTALNQVGTEGPVGASPGILLPTEPRMWLIDPTRGGQIAARLIGPVWDFGKVVDLRQISWKAEELIPTHVISKTQNTNLPFNPDVELRKSDNPFARTDASPAWSLNVGKKHDGATIPTATGRYWQMRVVLRTNGLAA